MEIKTFLMHRIRDFDAVFQAQLGIKTKTALFLFILLRQALKPFGVNENKIQGLVGESETKLFQYKFLARAKTLDFCFFQNITNQKPPNLF